MRYFKWGVSRLILESDPMPDVVPMFIEGPQEAMNEERTFPRFLPRPGKNISITFGDKLDGEKVFGDLRARWKQIHEQEEKRNGKLEIGVLNDNLKYSEEVVKLRKECTLRVRQAVQDLRRQRGHPDEDPKAALAETWLRQVPTKVKEHDGGITRVE